MLSANHSSRNLPVELPSLLESCRTIRQALQIQAQVFLHGLHRHKFTLSKLISFFAFSGLPGLDHSRLLLSQVTEPTIFNYNTIIRGYSGTNSPIEALALFKSMISQGSLVPNNFTFPFLLNCCAKLPGPELGLEIHSHIIKYGFDSDTFVTNSLIHYYIRFGDLDCARQLFDESADRDVVSFNTMINGYAKKGRAVDVLILFEGMRVSGFIPDEYTFVSLLSVCSSLGDPKTGKLIHQLVCKNFGFDSFGVLLKNALVDMYAKCELMNMADRVFQTIESSKSITALSCMVSGYARRGEIEIAHRCFNEIPEKDLISWTAMIDGYSQIGRYEEALDLFQEMLAAGIKADEITMSIVLSACAQMGAFGLGKRLHHYIEIMSLNNHSPILNTALVDMYAKCGCIETALHAFHGVDEKLKTVCLFNSMISGLSQHGFGKKAITFFRDMEELGLSPDEVTFVGVLCACSHCGLIEDGKEIFDSMVDKYRIRPRIEHYGCMVDLLGRGGYLEEAYDFIEKMPIGANSIIWLSLLGACRIHRNVEIAEIAGKRLLELDPNQGGRSVLLSCIFSSEKRWDDAREVRKLKAYKPPGWSYIEWNGSLHQFLANDNSHPQAREINLKLEEMKRLLRSAGHAPDTEQVSFDIDEEEKESVVNYHSEKLAFAFGLINMDPKMTIRIVKNIRICNDCHISLKLLSDIYDRQIIVRDRIRFHHMRKGLCSCGDYW